MPKNNVVYTSMKNQNHHSLIQLAHELFCRENDKPQMTPTHAFIWLKGTCEELI